MASETPSTHNPLHPTSRPQSHSDASIPRTIPGDFDENHDPFYQGGSTHWAALSALAPISFGENSLLEEIEKRESEEETATAIQSRARAGTRLRSGTVANELQIRTQGARRGTIVDDIGERPMLLTDRATRFRQLFNFMESLVPRLQQRLNFYTSVFFFITILSLANYYDDPKSWYGRVTWVGGRRRRNRRSGSDADVDVDVEGGGIAAVDHPAVLSAPREERGKVAASLGARLHGAPLVRAAAAAHAARSVGE